MPPSPQGEGLNAPLFHLLSRPAGTPQFFIFHFSLFIYSNRRKAAPPLFTILYPRSFAEKMPKNPGRCPVILYKITEIRQMAEKNLHFPIY